MTRALATAWLAGALFGVGLVVSGMTVPSNIQAFLDVSGSFRPELALVMGAAVLVYAIAIRLPRAGGVRPSSWPSARASLDWPLLVGSAVFGVGWGIAGYCPGPSIVAAAGGRLDAIVFVASSALGILCADALRARGEAGASGAVGET